MVSGLHPVNDIHDALLRTPAPTLTDGLRAVDRGAPCLATFRAQHAAYTAALEAAGVATETLSPLDAYPDSVFVEDTALLLPDGFVLLRPGAPSRAGEVAAIAPAVEALGRRLGIATESLPAGHVDGGDVLVTGTEVLIGRSARTDAAGAAALRGMLAARDRTVRVVETPPGVLHFKSDCAYLGDDVVIATRRLAASGAFSRYRVLPVPEGEEAAANCLRVNAVVLVADGFPATATLLEAEGYSVVRLAMDQAALLDGGLSCLSLRIAAPAR